MNNDQFKHMLELHPELKQDLFIRGFLITDRDSIDMDQFPFYGNWKLEKHGRYNFMAHKLAGMHIYEDSEHRLFFIMGHAYNPFTMEHEEIRILQYIAAAYGTEQYNDRIDEMTGVFVFGSVVDDRIEFQTDPSGMQSACCAKIGNYSYISSHSQLVGDICNLEMCSFVKDLIRYKWYGRVMGPYLPGDITPFRNVKRIVPDIRYTYKKDDKRIGHHRYYPLIEIRMTESENDYNEVIKKAADILKNNMVLITRKWDHPWISLTGGIDSNTTFAAANGVYDKYEAFSYISAEKEIRDAEAAQRIADHFGVKHHVYNIPEKNEELPNYEVIYEILMHNNGYVGPLKANEARKRIYLRNNAGCDVEVKSWVSETIRAYWYKHYGRKTMPKLSPKLYRNLYKIFLTDRKLAHKIDRLFEKYIKDYEYNRIPECYPTADMHFNEVTWGSWGGMRISEMKYCFDITFAYNNRKFLDLLFRVPLDKRISDQHHLDMKKYLNPELGEMGIRVVNMKETDFRAFCLNFIFTVNTFLPF